LGWPESRIRVIDDDLGASGARPGRRKGFGEMLELMRSDEVAIVFVTEISRLSRNPLDAEEFLWVAISRGVLIAVDGTLYAPEDERLQELFNLRFQNLFAWWDHANLRQRFDKGKRVKSSLGHAVHHPPAGFIMPEKGKWIPDPDPRVGEAIARVFSLYLALGSANKAGQYLRAHGLLLPRRTYRGQA
jgi:DNA invertase Pin-like site-specific DNA recombinase